MSKNTPAAKTAAKTPAKQAPIDPRESAETAAEDKPVAPRPRRAIVDDAVTVVVPKVFKLTGDDHIVRQIEAGVQEMSRADAEHWFAKAHGVTIKD